jgi:hypothetical protein
LLPICVYMCVTQIGVCGVSVVVVFQVTHFWLTYSTTTTTECQKFRGFLVCKTPLWGGTNKKKQNKIKIKSKLPLPRRGVREDSNHADTCGMKSHTVYIFFTRFRENVTFFFPPVMDRNQIGAQPTPVTFPLFFVFFLVISHTHTHIWMIIHIYPRDRM